jgi:uncharacterized oxidoreductase
LRALVAAVFRATGSAEGEAWMVGDHLVDANLAGHELHGVIRVSKYVDRHAKGMVIANQHADVVRETPCNVVIDGQFGYGGHNYLSVCVTTRESASAHDQSVAC